MNDKGIDWKFMLRFWTLMSNNKVSFFTKLTYWVSSIGYFLFPIDFVPDVFIPIGWGDDIAIGVILAYVFVHNAKEQLYQWMSMSPQEQHAINESRKLRFASLAIFLGAGWAFSLGFLNTIFISIGGSILVSMFGKSYFLQQALLKESLKNNNQYELEAAKRTLSIDYDDFDDFENLDKKKTDFKQLDDGEEVNFDYLDEVGFESEQPSLRDLYKDDPDSSLF